jgi:hypothetical protein
MALPSQVIGVLNHDSEAAARKIHMTGIKKIDPHVQALSGTSCQASSFITPNLLKLRPSGACRCWLNQAPDGDSSC